MATATVTVISPEGQTGQMPQENLEAAKARGFKMAVQVTSPEGQTGWIPQENADRAVKERGFKMGQATTETEAPPDTRAARLSHLWEGVKQAGRGVLAMGPQTTGEKVMSAVAPGSLPLKRIAETLISTGKAAPQVPQAIKDINANPNPTPFYSQALGETMGNLNTQAAMAAGGEYAPEAGAAAVKAGKVAAKVVTSPEVVGGALGTAIGHHVGNAAGGGVLGSVVGHAVREGVRSLAKGGKAAAETAAEAPKFPDYTAKPSAAATPEAAFEKVFNQPLKNYLDENGKFNMQDFMKEVVKPGTAPPAQVIARTFGAEGVDLVESIAGKKLAKWERVGSGPKTTSPKTAVNASGESSASQEAINRAGSERAAGVKRVVVDTRSGIERPLIGVDAVDYQPRAYESVEFRGGNRDGEVIDHGHSARPYNRKR
jgi:hypothetical protein